MIDQYGVKWLPAKQLAEALLRLPEGSSVTCNAVGNLGVKDSTDSYAGFIEFLFNGEFVEL